MNFKKNDVINDILVNYYNTFRLTLNTANYVPAKVNGKIIEFISKNLFKKLREVDIFYLLYLEEIGVKLGWFDRIKIWWSGKRPIYKLERKMEKKLAKQNLINK